MFETLSFEDAVKLFKEWGFQVEPGPRSWEITLILRDSDHCSCTVYDAEMLPQIAAVAMQVRWHSGAIFNSVEKDLSDSKVTVRQGAFPAGAASLMLH